jgi:hypothetical protein
MNCRPDLSGQSGAGRDRPRRVVYTCLFGFSEHFNDFTYARDDDIDFICFTDDADLRSDFWNIKHVDPGQLDPARAAKRIKALPHRFLPDHACSLYIDNTIRLKAAPARLFDDYLAGAASSIVCFRHPQRDCVYEEAEAVIAAGFDSADRVGAQMRLYRRMGYPDHNGLVASGFLLRRHHDPVLKPVMERWHRQVLRHSHRDQLSMNPVMWFDRLGPAYLDLHFNDQDLLDWPVVKNAIRLPRDFDDARYLQLNPDVSSNARRHFLVHGAQEGRPYK